MPRPTQNAFGDYRPTFSHRSLVAVAIWCAPNKHARLADIYEYYSGQFMYYRRNEGTWKTSIKKTLSANNCFLRLTDVDSNTRDVIWTLHPTVQRHEIFANQTLLWQCDPFKLDEHDKIRLYNELVDLDNILNRIQYKLLHQSKNSFITPSLDGKQPRVLCTPAQPRRRRHRPTVQPRRITDSGNTVNRHSNVIRPVRRPDTLVQQSTPRGTINKLIFDHQFRAVSEMLKQKVGGHSLMQSVQTNPYTLLPLIKNTHQLCCLGYTETYFPINLTK